jgi:hypothetical protein
VVYDDIGSLKESMDNQSAFNIGEEQLQEGLAILDAAIKAIRIVTRKS